MSAGSKIKKFLPNKELPVFLFFLLLSFLFWYLNELGKDLEGTISYPVRYINPPKERIISGDLPDKLEMNLRGPGYSILKMKISGSRAPVVIDFSRVSPKRLPGIKPNYYLLTSGLIQGFSKQLHADFEIISIYPDTLYFSYDRLITRRVAVKPDIDIEPVAGSRIVIVPDPDSISVTGPEQILDTLGGISTRHRSFRRMDENFRARIPLTCPAGIQTDQKRVTVEITVLGRPDSLFSKKQQDNE